MAVIQNWVAEIYMNLLEIYQELKKYATSKKETQSTITYKPNYLTPNR